MKSSLFVPPAAPQLPIDRSAIAWELLRRDPAYRRAAAAASTVLPHAAARPFTGRWGLHFRRRPVPSRR